MTRIEAIDPTAQQPKGDIQSANVFGNTAAPDFSADRADMWSRNGIEQIKEANAFDVANFWSCLAVRKYQQWRANRKGETFDHYSCF